MVVDYEYRNLIKSLSYLLTNVYPSFSEEIFIRLKSFSQMPVFLIE